MCLYFLPFTTVNLFSKVPDFHAIQYKYSPCITPKIVRICLWVFLRQVNGQLFLDIWHLLTVVKSHYFISHPAKLNEMSSQECPICYTEPEIQYKLHCNHNICYTCSPKVINSTNRCPLCRAHILIPVEVPFASMFQKLLLFETQRNNVKGIMFCLDHGADISGRFDGDPMSLAVTTGNQNLVKLFCKLGRDLSYNDYDLVHQSARQDNVHIFEILLNKVGLDMSHETLERLFVVSIHKPVLKILCGFIIKNNLKQHFAYALMFAVRNGMTSIVKTLFTNDVKTHPNYDQIDYILFSSCSGNTSTIKELIRQQVLPIDGNRALSCAIENDSLIMVTYLLSYVMVDIDGVVDGISFVSAAAERHSYKILRVLLEHGANTEDIMREAFDTGDLGLLSFLLSFSPHIESDEIQYFLDKQAEVNEMISMIKGAGVGGSGRRKKAVEL